MNSFTRYVTWSVLLLAMMCGGFLPKTEAQLSSHFGKNKVHYKDFHWATLETQHFDIYFYRGEEALARNTKQMAERAYSYLSVTLRHTFHDNIPLIVYASSDDFQQTEVIQGFLGEGIGGVTESVKGRIVIPFLGSYRTFNHVLVHELVHAFQFDILRGEGAGLGGFSSGVYLPLWCIEGMAEYLAEYRNPMTDLWLRDAVSQDSLPKPDEIESINDIRAYRFGQSLWAFLCDTYGDDMPGELLHELATSEGWEKTGKTLTTVSWKDIYRNWLDMVRSTYASEDAGRYPISDHADRLITHDPDRFSLNILPAISPDGKYLAFISDRNFYRTIYLASSETGEILSRLVEGERRGTFESLRFLNTSLSWSPDSRKIAFNARAGGENAIYILNVQTQDIEQKIVPDVNSLSFLAWSPAGERIAFTGTKHGQEDLYLVNLHTRDQTQLTSDVFSNRHPAWSPDAKALAFSTDAGQFSHPSKQQFGPSNIAVYDLETGQSPLLTDTPFHDFTPVWSPTGRMLAFISDRNGLYNIYLAERVPVTGNGVLRRSGMAPPQTIELDIFPLTDVNTGIVGLTEDNPALSWAREAGTLAFSGFSDRGWDIFTLDNPERTYRDYCAEIGDEAAASISRPSQTSEPTRGQKNDWAYPLPETASIAPEDYHARLSPEYILAGGGGNNESFVILARLGFSDMLSNHRLTIGLNMTEVFDESDFLVAYSNQANRLSYEMAVFQFTRDSRGTYRLDHGELDIEVQRGIGMYGQWPFDKFSRLEIGLESWLVSGAQEDESGRQELDDQFFLSPGLAYVYDTALYTRLGPLDGRRSRFSLFPALGDFTSLTLVADQRWYVHTTRRGVLAFRLLTAASVGENARIFTIGGPDTFRVGDLDPDDERDETLEGTRLALGNVEYRFPLLPSLNLLRGAIFWDMAMAWENQVQPFTAEGTSFVRFHDLRGAYGAGLRVPISSPFGVFTLRLDLVQETDLSQHIGTPRLLFSLGNAF